MRISADERPCDHKPRHFRGLSATLKFRSHREISIDGLPVIRPQSPDADKEVDVVRDRWPFMCLSCL